MTDTFDDLGPIVDARWERALDAHRKSLAESRRVAEELSEIDAMRAAARAAMDEITTHRLVGGDTLWDGWLLQRRGQLLQRAAMARAVELDTASAARTALARQDAIAALAAAERAAAQTRRTRARQDALEALMILQAGQGTPP